MPSSGRQLGITFTAIVVAFVLGLAGCAEPGPETLYYRHVDLDGRFEYVGRHLIPETLAASVNSYRVLRDGAGRLLEIEYRTRGTPGPSAALGGVAKVVFSYEDGFETRRYLDASGEPHARFDPSRIRIDGQGRRVGMSFTGQAGTTRRGGVASYDWEVDERGYRTRSVRLDASGTTTTDSLGVCEVHWVYDDSGNMIEWANHGPDGWPVQDGNGVAVKRYAYDPEGNRTEVRTLSLEGDLVAVPEAGRALGEAAFCAVHRYGYDGHGYRVQDTCLSAEEQRVGHLEMDYDDGGFLTEIREYWSPSTTRPTRSVRYVYDDNGDLRSRTVFDGDGNVIAGR
jgi:YD repeat-containing protein